MKKPNRADLLDSQFEPRTSNLSRPGLGVPIAALALLLLMSLLLAVAAGSTSVPLRAALDGDPTARAILFQLRVPRALLAALIGATLAVAGLTFQTLLRNPLADPFILGVSGGAACGAAIATALGLARIPGVVPLVAFGGACAA